MVLSKLIKKIRLRNINNVFVFAKQCQQVYHNYTLSFRNDHNKNNWLFIMKTKPRSHIQVVHDGNEKVTRGEDIFQLDELVDLYWVISSTELEEDLNFLVAENTYVHFDLDELNDILSTIENKEVDKDEIIEQFKFNKEDDGHENDIHLD